jgi:DNA-binding response OmpR family regulator
MQHMNITMEKKRILIADDDESFLAALAIRFKKEDYDVITTFDGYNALAQAANKHPDMMILDINMPCSSGFDVQERLQKLGRLLTPIIYITGEKSARVEMLSKQLDALAVFYKPFDTDELLLTVKKALAES